MWILPRLSTEMCSLLVCCAAWSKSSAFPFVVSQLLFFFSAFLHPKHRRKILGLLPFPGLFLVMFVSHECKWAAGTLTFPQLRTSLSATSLPVCSSLSLRRWTNAAALLKRWLVFCRVEQGAVELLDLCKDIVCSGGVNIHPFPTILLLYYLLSV